MDVLHACYLIAPSQMMNTLLHYLICIMVTITSCYRQCKHSEITLNRATCLIICASLQTARFSIVTLKRLTKGGHRGR